MNAELTIDFEAFRGISMPLDPRVLTAEWLR